MNVEGVKVLAAFVGNGELLKPGLWLARKAGTSSWHVLDKKKEWTCEKHCQYICLSIDFPELPRTPDGFQAITIYGRKVQNH